MDNTAQITTSKRNYSVALGTVEWGSGIHKSDGSWSQWNKQAIIADFTETVVTTRAMTECTPDASSLDMATYDFGYGSTTDWKHAYFDFEKSSVTSECRRSSEAGFYEKVTTTRTCTKVNGTAI